MSTYDDLTRLRDEWQALQPMAPDDERRLWRKLKLEWNFHSNHIEGNTLTYGETELLLIHGQTSGDHALRDYVEMQAHDLAIEHLRDIAGDQQRPLSESDIRDLNRILLKEPFWKEAITTDGQPTRIEILPGEYKAQPNNVRTASGEIFCFADPVDVSSKMTAMLANLHQTMDEAAKHPVEVASWLHHEFVLIHPFGDGNGRTARLLVNYVLMRSGYVPLIVPTERKDSYLAALRLADVGDRTGLTGFLTGCAETALRRGIRAAKGESIDDEGDLEKEIEVFKRRSKPIPREIEVRSPEVMARTYNESLRPLLFEFIRTMSKLDDLFAHLDVTLNGKQIQVRDLQRAEDLPFPHDMDVRSGIDLRYKWAGFLGENNEAFGVSASLSVWMQEGSFSISGSGAIPEERLYGRPILESFRTELCRKALASVFKEIKTKTENGD